jgi:hypothetical protein
MRLMGDLGGVVAAAESQSAGANPTCEMPEPPYGASPIR